MVDSSQRRVAVLLMVCAVALVALPRSADAQRSFEPLFDKFNFRLEGSWVGLSTDIRLDSELLGRGTTLSFENDLNLGSRETIPSLEFNWQIARRHKLSTRWQRINRDSTAQALTEIQWGDDVIPIDASVTLGFDIDQFFVDYAYFPWVKERWAGGFGIGIRVMDIAATLAWEGQNIQEEGKTEAQGTGPLPYVYFEYRRLFTEHWRFKAGLGWLQVKIGDIDGGQWVGHADIEYLIGRRWSVGGSVNIATIDVDWAGVETEAGESVLTAALNMDINDFSVFARIRF